ncbi:MAG: ribose-phosphate diphosphokinase, partial [Chloroflexota bacterium]
VDLHAPAIQGFFDVPVDNLTAIPILAQHLVNERLSDVVVVSPDSGGVARASQFNSVVGADLAFIAKSRPEPDMAKVLNVVGDVRDKVAVIVDDMISTGSTLVEAANLLCRRGARSVLAYAVHPVLADDAVELIERSSLEQVVVMNTLPVPNTAQDGKIKVLDIAPLLAEAIKRIHEGRSVSALFQATRFRQEMLI